VAGVTQRTSRDTHHYRPTPVSPSCFTGLSQSLLQTSASPTFNPQVHFCSQARPFPTLLHLSPKLPSLQSVKPGKELPLAPSPAPLQEVWRAGAPHGAPQWVHQRSTELCCNTSRKRCSSRRDVQAGDGQRCHRLRNCTLETAVKAVQMF